MIKIVNEPAVLRKLCSLMNIKKENDKLTFMCPKYVIVDVNVNEPEGIECDCVTSFHTVCTKCNGTTKTNINYLHRSLRLYQNSNSLLNSPVANQLISLNRGI